MTTPQEEPKGEEPVIWRTDSGIHPGECFVCQAEQTKTQALICDFHAQTLKPIFESAIRKDERTRILEALKETPEQQLSNHQNHTLGDGSDYCYTCDELIPEDDTIHTASTWNSCRSEMLRRAGEGK